MAKLFADLLSDIYDITKRPDLVAETKLAIRMATLKAHHSDFYPRDIAESGLTWVTPAYTQSLEFKNVFPNFRALKYIRKISSGVPGEFFTVITPEQVLDSYRRDRNNVCYMAGRMIEIKSNSLDSDMIVGYYADPDVTESGYSSWVADNADHVIIMEAAAVIFKMIGFDEQASMFAKLTELNLMELKTNYLSAVGY